MSIPSFFDYLNILFYNGFNDGNLLFLEAVIINQFYRINIVLCLTVIFYNMNMNRLMVIRVEQESETKQDEFVGIIISILSYRHKDRRKFWKVCKDVPTFFVSMAKKGRKGEKSMLDCLRTRITQRKNESICWI
jgi:hypothetical protein